MAMIISVIMVVAVGTACSAPEPVVPPPATSAAPAAAVSRCAGHPTPGCTGVPPGTKLTEVKPNFYGTFRVMRNGMVLDGVHIPGDLLITAYNVTVRNSQIDGKVQDYYDGQNYSFTITDSTVGREKGCDTAPGIQTADFTALRVHVRGHGDGFSVSGDDVTVRDSFVLLCSNPGDHSDGIQTISPTTGLTFDHNTVDQRRAHFRTSPIFLVDKTMNVSLTNNLLIGGTYTIRLRNGRGTQVARNNAVVDQTWDYGPVDAQCKAIDWRDNTLVTIDGDYAITSTVGPLKCPK